MYLAFKQTNFFGRQETDIKNRDSERFHISICGRPRLLPLRRGKILGSFGPPHLRLASDLSLLDPEGPAKARFETFTPGGGRRKPDELPAVTVPSLAKAGFKDANFSSVVCNAFSFSEAEFGSASSFCFAMILLC